MSQLNEVKDRVARLHGFRNWEHVREHDRKGLFEPSVLEEIYDEVTWTFIAERSKKLKPSLLSS